MREREREREKERDIRREKEIVGGSIKLTPSTITQGVHLCGPVACATWCCRLFPSLPLTHLLTFSTSTPVEAHWHKHTHKENPQKMKRYGPVELTVLDISWVENPFIVTVHFQNSLVENHCSSTCVT